MEGKNIFAQKRQTGGGAIKYAIVTADDFGQSPEVNQAVIQAHRSGILTCASLMMAGPFVKQAVELAKMHPNLRVGLHLVLVDGFSVLKKKDIPLLVNDAGCFPPQPASAGRTYLPFRETKRQLAKECDAQAKKFLDTGLKPDHINSHHHLHIHPVIAGIVVEMARRYRFPAVRLPLQGCGLLKKKNACMTASMLPWTLLLRNRLRRAGVACNDKIFGLYETGHMNERNWLSLIPRLKPGVSEIFCHPAKPAETVKSSETDHRHDEYRALLSEKVKDRFKREKIVLTSFSEIRRQPIRLAR